MTLRLLLVFFLSGFAMGGERWNVLEVSELPEPSEVDYPNLVTTLALRNVETGEEIRAEGYGIFQRALTSLGGLKVGDEFEVTALLQAPEGSEKEARTNDLTNFDLPLRWIGAELMAEAPPTGVDAETQQKVYKIERFSIQRTLMAQIGPVTGGGSSEFFFYGDRGFYERDFWKTSEVEGGGVFAVIEQFDAILKTRGVRLIVVPTPSTMTIFPEMATNLYYRPEVHGPINTEIQAMSEALREKGVEVLDITTPLIAERYFDHDGVSYPIYRPNDTHWSSWAASLVAELCAGKAGRSAAMSPFRQTVQVATLKSDIAEILASKHPYRDQRVAPHRSPLFVVEPLNDEAATWLDKSREFPGARVHLIGDSFVDALSEHQADLHAHLVRLLGEPVARIERYGGCSQIAQAWLDSYGKAEEQPEVVIFQFGERFAAIDSKWPPLAE